MNQWGHVGIASMIPLAVFGWLIWRAVRRRHWHLPAATGAAVTLLIGFSVILHKTAVMSYEIALNRWRADGLATETKQLIPGPVADEENAAILYQRAFQMMDGIEENEWNKLDPPNAEVALQLAAEHRSIIDLLNQASLRPKCKWPTVYVGLNTLLPHFIYTERSARLLAADAMAHAKHQRFDGAERSLTTAFRMARDFAREPFLLAQIRASKMQRIVLDAWREGFRRHAEPSPLLSSELAKFDHRAVFAQNLMAEAIDTRSAIPVDKAGLLTPVGLLLADPDQENPYVFIPGNFHRDMAVMLNRERIILGEMSKQRYLQNPSTLPGTHEIPNWAYYTRITALDVVAANEMVASAESDIAVAQLANRLRTYKKEHGQYPNNSGRGEV